jgi:DNA-directed RNA polymerase
MKFLKTSAPLILKASTASTIQWYTPNGFKVVQRKPNLKIIQANTLLGEFVGNKRAMVQMAYKLDTPNSRKHGNSIAPNLIHSLDACHLQNTVLSLEDGLSFNMIHDSYGTHASDSRAMYEAIRQQFYDIYKNNDILQNWIKEQPEFKLPDLPTNGELDLTEVLKSEYFFA